VVEVNGNLHYHKRSSMRKYREFLITVLMVFIPLSLFSQAGGEQIRTLESNLHSQSGKEKILILAKLTEYYSQREPDKAVEYGEEALVMLKAEPDDELKATVLISLASSYKNTGDYKQSLACSREALELSKKSGNENPMARSLILVGINHIYTSEYSDALEFFKSALEVFTRLGGKKEIASALNSIGITYDLMGRYESALNYYLKSLKIKEEVGDPKLIASTLNNIGVLYNVLDFPDNALQYFQRALKINRKINKKNSIAISLTNIGNIYYKKKDYKKALEYYQEAFQIDEELGSQSGMSDSLNNIGLTLFGGGRHQDAMMFYRQALALRKKMGDKRLIARTLLNMAEVDKRSGSYNRAVQKLNEVLSIAGEVNIRGEKASAYKALYEIYEKKNDKSRAFIYLKNYQVLNREIMAKKSREKVMEMEKRAQMEKKEKELELLKKSEQIQHMTIRRQKLVRNAVIAGAFLLLLVVLVLLYLYRSKQRINRELEAANQKLDRSARTDPLTGLSNRRDMFEKITYEQDRISRVEKPFSLALCDIDDFKSFNDQYGHDCGDFILKELAVYLPVLLRQQDTLGRWGGEEFLILLPETTMEGAVTLSEKIREAVASKSFRFQGIPLSATLTFGVCAWDGKEPLDECLKRADAALYEGKKLGKNRVVVSN